MKQYPPFDEKEKIFCARCNLIIAPGADKINSQNKWWHLHCFWKKKAQERENLKGKGG